jgi:hypothetical protein
LSVIRRPSTTAAALRKLLAHDVAASTSSASRANLRGMVTARRRISILREQALCRIEEPVRDPLGRFRGCRDDDRIAPGLEQSTGEEPL